MIYFLAALAVFAQDTVSYANDVSWLCRPGRRDACAVDLTTTVVAANGRLTTEPWAANPQAPIDCFYVYPTVSRDTTDRSDMNANDDERSVVAEQFARFASVCRPYAPLYRQVSLRGLRALMSGGATSFGPLNGGIGYEDVAAAWKHYLARDNQGRGVVLIGHSQGAMVLETLLRREIDGKPSQSRVVSAMLLGSTVAVPDGKDVGGAFQSMPLCRSATQVGCIIAYASFRNTQPPSERAYFGRVSASGMKAACTNPAALSGGRGALHAYFANGSRLVSPPRARYAWMTKDTSVATPFASVPGLLTAECVSDSLGTRLDVTVHADSADPRADDIPGDIGPAVATRRQWGLHLVDVSLTIGNLMDIVAKQSAAFTAASRSTGAAPRGTIPRTASGKPDMNGIWQALGNAHYDIEPHSARGALAWRPGPVVPVPAKEVVSLGAVAAVPSGQGIVVGGRIPYTSAGLAKKKENQEHWLERDPEIKCYQPGVPRATYMPYPFQIFQSERAFFITYEYAGAVRNIYLKDPGPPQVDTWMGQSVGTWEGDTFVVRINGFNAESWFDRAGNHHSEAMTVVERYSMLGPDHIQYEATIDDPQTFTSPWTIRLPLYRNVNPEARLGQFKCVEFVEELMYGHLRKVPLKP